MSNLCNNHCLLCEISQSELKEKITSQLTEEEKTEGYTWEGEFFGSLFHPTEDKEIPFCEKCLTRIMNMEELFCTDDYFYLCSECRKTVTDFINKEKLEQLNLF